MFFKAARTILLLSKKLLFKTQLFYYKKLFAERFVIKTLQNDGLLTVSFDISASSIIILDKAIIRKNFFIRAEKNGKVIIGKEVFFNNGCSINCMNEIRIGDNCLFGENVKLYDHNHEYANKKALIQHQQYLIGKIIIGSNCWIGSNVTILKDVEIGDNVIIGANCVIHKSIPSNAIVVNQQNLIIKSYENKP